MTLNTISDPPVSPGPAAAPPSMAAPPPALLTSAQLMAAQGISRRMLKKWNRGRVIPSMGVRHARRFDLKQVMEALRSHGQPATAPGLGGPAGDAADG